MCPRLSTQQCNIFVMGSGANCLPGPWNQCPTFYLARWITADLPGDNQQIPSISLSLSADVNAAYSLASNSRKTPRARHISRGAVTHVGQDCQQEPFQHKSTGSFFHKLSPPLSFTWDLSVNSLSCQKYLALKLLNSPLCSQCVALKTSWMLPAQHQADTVNIKHN